MELLNPPIEQLVEEIVAVNRAWKVACDLFEETLPLATSLRDLKTCKQVLANLRNDTGLSCLRSSK